MMPWSRIAHRAVNLGPVKTFLTRQRIISRAYFEYLYLRDDPYRTRRQEKLERTERAFRLLGGFHGRSALEVGCGQGEMTPLVAAVADQVLAVDISAGAIRRAQTRHRGNPRLRFRTGDMLDAAFPWGSYDFIFCSEVLYYMHLSDLDGVASRLTAGLRPGGALLLLHARSLKDDTVGLELKEFGARTAHQLFLRDPALRLEWDVLEGMHRITLLSRPGAGEGASPAARIQ